MPAPKLWDEQLQFLSKGDILRHWHVLLQSRGSRLMSHPVPTNSTNLDMVYDSGEGWRYEVSLSTPKDSEALAALGEEFVRTHSDIFAKEYQGVDHKVWCQYLGLHADSARREKAASEIAAMGLAHASRGVNFQALCHTGCTLKCEAKRVEQAPELSSSSQAGSSTRNGTNGHSTNGHATATNGTPRAGVVGYVHFTLEEGTPAGTPRFSKRLKQKRGECTREYTKVSHLCVTNSHRGNGLGALMLTSVLHRVSCLDPSYAREIFLTVIKRNKRAVDLYQSLALRTIGENTTYLGRDAGAKARPIIWYQMGLCEENGNTPGGARTAQTTTRGRNGNHAEEKGVKKPRK